MIHLKQFLSLSVIIGVAFAAGARAAEPQPAPAGPGWMPADAIRSEFAGKYLSGVYPTGRAWSEDIFTDGTTDYRESAVRRPGKWWLTALEFCFSYPPPGEGGCFRVVKVSSNCYELYDFSSEFGRLDAPPRQKGGWNGRMWRLETTSTCEEQPSV